MPPNDTFVENEPTAMDVKDYTMMTHHMCVRCGHSAGNKCCLRRLCAIDGCVYVPNKGYYERRHTFWNSSTLQYELT